jgi:tetratricopeptide (TPR) repeat protein
MKKLNRFRLFAGLVVLCTSQAFGQPAGVRAESPKLSRGDAYFNYSMAHIYSELAAAYGNRAEYLNQAIDYYKAAIKADSAAGFLSTELSDLYVQAGQINKAVSESEATLKANPKDLSARRILGRIYARLIGDPNQNRIREDMVRKALDQYAKITESDPKDTDSWVMIGRLEKIASNASDSEKAYKKVLELDPSNEDALTGLAMAAAEKGDLTGAAAMLEKSTTQSPNPRSLAQLAETYEQLKDFKNASKAWQKALDTSGGNPEIKRALANALVMSDQLDPAIEVYEELLAEEPKDLVSVLRLSQIHRQKRNFTKAREYAQQAKDLDGGNLEVRYNDVYLLEAEGKQTEAIAALREIVDSSARKTYLPQEKQNRVLLLERLSYMLRANEQFADAAKSFEEAAALEPQTSERMQAQLVETYRQAKDYSKASALLDEALKMHPEDRTLRLQRGQLLAEMGKAADGAAVLEKMLDGKQDLEVHLSLAQAWEKGKNYPEMAKALDNAEKASLTPADRERVFFLRGAMFEKQKKLPEAEAEFQKILQEDPNNAGALNYLGYMLADKNLRVPEALKMIQKALDQDPHNSAYLDSLGWAYYRLDQLDEAEKYLKLSLERLSKDPTVHDHLGDVYLKQGKLKEAIQQWERSLAEWTAAAPGDRDQAEVAKVQKKLDGAKVRLAKEPATTPRKKN